MVKLDLITDIDMMVEKGIRGGISMISHRHAEANDPRMGDAYNPNILTKHCFTLTQTLCIQQRCVSLYL